MLAARLADDIVNARGGNAYVGVLGARYVLPVLTATGHHDVAFTGGDPDRRAELGYWTDVAKFTALGEQWPADTCSRNHHFFGAIVQWFYEDLAGMRPLEAGYRKIEFRPEIPKAGLEAVSASYESVRGTIASPLAPDSGGTGARRDGAPGTRRVGSLFPHGAFRRTSPRSAGATR